MRGGVVNTLPITRPKERAGGAAGPGRGPATEAAVAGTRSTIATATPSRPPKATAKADAEGTVFAMEIFSVRAVVIRTGTNIPGAEHAAEKRSLGLQAVFYKWK